MDPAKLQIGVPTYGRAWTRESGGSYRLVGTCPTDKSSSAYKSLTSMVSVSDADIPGVLANAGVQPQDIQYFRDIVHPQRLAEYVECLNGLMEIRAQLQPHESRFIEITLEI